MPITIIKPTPEDAAGIQNLFYKTWLATYPNAEFGITEADVHEHFKDAFTQESLSKVAEHVAPEMPNRLILVAKDDDTVIGIVRAFIREKANQLQAIYVLPEYQRQGVGTMLWQEALKFFDPAKDIIVQVATYNTQAINFYKKIGFVDTGKRFTEKRHRMPVSGVLIPEMEMVRTS